jgi:hypothetical protein
VLLVRVDAAEELEMAAAAGPRLRRRLLAAGPTYSDLIREGLAWGWVVHSREPSGNYLRIECNRARSIQIIKLFGGDRAKDFVVE